MRYVFLISVALLTLVYGCASNSADKKFTLEQNEQIVGDPQSLKYLAEQTANVNFSIDNETAGDVERKGSYKIKGKKYEVFANNKNFQQIGEASWYGPNFHGKKTASGERFDMYAMTAAHKTLPLGTMVEVTNLKTGAKIRVRINDPGPFHGGRIIDLSKAAAQKLGIISNGKGKVHIKSIQQ